MGAQAGRILIIDPGGSAMRSLAYPLVQAGYSVSGATSCEDGLLKARSERPHCILIEESLLQPADLVYRAIKSDQGLRAVPLVLVLTRAGGEGAPPVQADGYVRAPIDPGACVETVRAAIGRGPSAVLHEPLVLGGLVIDVGRHRVFVDGRPVELTATEFRLLHFLASQPGRSFSRDLLLRSVCESEGSARVIDAHVGSLRRRLGPYRDLIRTVRGVGYGCAQPAS